MFDTASRRVVIAASGAAIGLGVLLTTWPILTSLSNWGIQDWDQHTFHHGVARHAIIEFAEPPLWNPYNQSGEPLLANPESRFLAPTFPLVLVFGEVVGLKLEILLHMLLGAVGTQLLLRSFGVGWLGALAGGLVFGLNSWYSVHLAVGHIWALTAAYMPWVLLCQRKALGAPVYVIPTALLLVAMLFGGGVYPLVMTLLLMGGFAVAQFALERRDAARHLSALAFVAAIALPLSAVKLLPTGELMLANPRVTAVESGYTGSALANALLDRDQAIVAAYRERPEDFNGTGVHEGAYTGAIPLLLFLCGVVLAPRRAAPIACVSLSMFWISMGTHVTPSLWYALHTLPVFDNMRMVQRFAIAALLPLCIVAGLGFDEIARRLGARRLRIVVLGGLLLTLLADLTSVSRRVFEPAFSIPPRVVKSGDAFQQHRQPSNYNASGDVDRFGPHTTSSGLYPAFLANRGSVEGYLIFPHPTRAIPADAPAYRGETFLEHGRGTLRETHWSPNRIGLVLDLEAPDLLVVNQNFDPGWKVSGTKAEVVATGGLISVPVDPRVRALTLYYRPTSVVIGAGLSAASVLSLPWLARRLRRARTMHAA